MPTTRDSTPCPSPRYNRFQKGKGPITSSEPTAQVDVENAKTRTEIMTKLEQRLNESQELLEKLKKIPNPRQPAQTHLKVVSASLLENQPKIWTSPCYKRHLRLNENKMKHFVDRKDQRGRLDSIGISNTLNASIHEDWEEQCGSHTPTLSIHEDETDQSGHDQVEVTSTTATIATMQVPAEEEEGRRIRDSLLLPRVTALDEAINSWRKKIA
ncbi:hypothetical protein PGT21_017087 [Puccinia graminis f. sp. tritici]|uniref:Uncharacterized protein n=1 Tax=Puccinia graminis f. sp. tritici TaxID=56615 RepID=A0A5B0PY91_PUCGR|nr:hypothetical protein PGTUg99_008964 [Puccinia graminis f. sp. tritici]KAA1105729.1 hypothetical protein PGT21_017087 [Puccinia graminis f. sp. tritici]